MIADHPRVLVIDDDAEVVEVWLEFLALEGFRVEGQTDPEAGLRRALEERFDVVLCDVEMPGMRGPALLRRILAERPRQLVVLISAFGSIDLAVTVLREGAADFVSKPCKPEVLVHVLRRALREQGLHRELHRLQRQRPTGEESGDGIVARSASMRRVLALAERVARATGPVLLQGETGTGKTLLARHIHEWSDRADKPFVSVNGSTLPAPLAEAELFGVRRGAFTDASRDRDGLLRAANGGTLFLDEVTELPLAVQAKLLTVLESGQVRAVGADRPTSVDVRIVAASNTPLAEAVAQGTFRADLRFRLDVLSIEVPPLRRRPEDLEPLVDAWLARLTEREGVPVYGLTEQAWRWVRAWPWPGNVREIINRLQRAVVFADGPLLTVADLSQPTSASESEDEGRLTELLWKLAEQGMTLDDLGLRYLHVALRAAGGNKTEAARILGVDRRTLHRKVAAGVLDDVEGGG